MVSFIDLCHNLPTGQICPATEAQPDYASQLGFSRSPTADTRGPLVSQLGERVARPRPLAGAASRAAPLTDDDNRHRCTWCRTWIPAKSLKPSHERHCTQRPEQ